MSLKIFPNYQCSMKLKNLSFLNERLQLIMLLFKNIKEKLFQRDNFQFLDQSHQSKKLAKNVVLQNFERTRKNKQIFKPRFMTLVKYSIFG